MKTERHNPPSFFPLVHDGCYTSLLVFIINILPVKKNSSTMNVSFLHLLGSIYVYHCPSCTAFLSLPVCQSRKVSHNTMLVTLHTDPRNSLLHSLFAILLVYLSLPALPVHHNPLPVSKDLTQHEALYLASPVVLRLFSLFFTNFSVHYLFYSSLPPYHSANISLPVDTHVSHNRCSLTLLHSA